MLSSNGFVTPPEIGRISLNPQGKGCKSCVVTPMDAGNNNDSHNKTNTSNNNNNNVDPPFHSRLFIKHFWWFGDFWKQAVSMSVLLLPLGKEFVICLLGFLGAAES